MKQILAVALTLALPVAGMAQVFSDNFTGSSTIQSASPGAGTATSTDYEVFTSTGAPTTANYNLAANDLTLSSISGTSVFAELAARFPSTTLTVGQSIDLTITFKDTANVLITGENANSSLNVGLFNSGNVNLNQGLRLDGTQTTEGSQTYLGYVGRLFLNGNASAYNRNTQAIGTSTTSQNQDLLFNNASSSSAFNNPTGTGSTGNTGATGQVTGLSAGSYYTLSYTLTLSAANAILINNQLYNGTSATGTPILNMSGTETGSSFLTSTFDAFALGFRVNNGSGNPSLIGTLDISDITVNVPEPTALAFCGLGLVVLGVARRFKH
jgi:hypothetical protein